jgi:protein ImuB
VTSRGLFSADPARLTSSPVAVPATGAGELSWWAGPWPVDERWWDPEQSTNGRTARVQVLLDGGGPAMLLCYRQRRWYLEGVYE